MKDHGARLVAKMTALRDDGSEVAIVWLKFDEEPEDAATAYEVLGDGHLVPCELGKLSEWQKVAALVAEGGG